MKSLVGVKFSHSQVDLLKRVCHVLEPFYEATLQLSNDSSCISEVIPIVTQLKESLSKVSEDERGVKTFKKDLLASIERRMGHFEEMEQFSLASALDPRFFLSSFSKVENGEKARNLLIEK